MGCSKLDPVVINGRLLVVCWNQARNQGHSELVSVDFGAEE